MPSADDFFFVKLSNKQSSQVKWDTSRQCDATFMETIIIIIGTD